MANKNPAPTNAELLHLSRIGKTQDLHQTQAYAETMRRLGWRVIGNEDSYVYARNFGPLQLIKIQRATNPDWGVVRSIQQERFTILTHYDPALEAHAPPPSSFHATTNHIAHTASAFIDLEPNEDAILNGFRPETRRNIEKGLSSGLQFVSISPEERTPKLTNEINALQNSWKANRPHRDTHIPGFVEGIVTESRDTGRYFLALDQTEKVQAMLIYLESKNLGIYFIACSTDQANKQKAPTALTWLAIQHAKTRKMKFFDFYGIYDDRAPKVYQYWRGFTEFKMRFNPILVQYPLPQRQMAWNR